MKESRSSGWRNGRILTGRQVAEALAVEDGRVVAVGPWEEIRRAAAPASEWHDLGGRLVIPGLIDPHLHWLDCVGQETGIDLRGSRSLKEVGQRLGAAAARSTDGPLIGYGWDQERLVERRSPERHELDRIVPDRPVVLYRVCQHVAALNSAALDAIGIRRGAPTPSGGRIGVDREGEPNGLLYDEALQPVRTLLERAFRARETEAIRFFSKVAGRGVTCLGAMRALRSEIEAARLAENRASLPLDLRLYLAQDLAEDLPRLRSSKPGPHVRVAGVKLILDGSLGARTASLEEPYSDAPSESGLAQCSREKATMVAQAAAADGVQLALHAIGDRALRTAIEVGERVGGRLRIEHASLVPPTLEDRLVRLRVPVVVQPGFVTSDTWIEERLGPLRATWAYPFRRLLDRGVTLAASSDAPVESFDPWRGLDILVRRVGFSPEQALEMYTRSAGVALGEPGRGTLEPGAPADLVVLDATNLGDAIARGGPVRTVVHGGLAVAGEGAI